MYIDLQFDPNKKIHHLPIPTTQNVPMIYFLQIITSIISWIATLLQIKEHPYIMQTINATKNFYQQF